MQRKRKYTATLYWIQRVDIVVCVLDTAKTALNSNVYNYCTVVGGSIPKIWSVTCRSVRHRFLSTLLPGYLL